MQTIDVNDWILVSNPIASFGQAAQAWQQYLRKEVRQAVWYAKNKKVQHSYQVTELRTKQNLFAWLFNRYGGYLEGRVGFVSLCCYTIQLETYEC